MTLNQIFNWGMGVLTEKPYSCSFSDIMNPRALSLTTTTTTTHPRGLVGI